MAIRCPYFGKCGGCSSQHIDYGLQVENKRLQVTRASGLTDVKVFTGADYGYRTRMDFIFHKSGLGLRKKGSWKDIVDIQRCEIANANVNKLLSEIRSRLLPCDSFDMHRKSGTFRFAVIRSFGTESSISFVLNEDSNRLGDAQERIRAYASVSSAKSILITYVPADLDESIGSESFAIKGSAILNESYLGKTFSYHAQGFFQNNHEMAERMHHYCRDILSRYRTHGGHLLDLYGGVGTFGIMNADLFSSVTTVESFSECTAAAKDNALMNGATNVVAITLDASKLKRLDLSRPLFVLADPPRSGMDMKTIEQLNALSPESIIYISCNIEQLRKDLQKFPRYFVKSAAMFDLFPNTPHAESVVELVRR